jgi:hypothetical protein
MQYTLLDMFQARATVTTLCSGEVNYCSNLYSSLDLNSKFAWSGRDESVFCIFLMRIRWWDWEPPFLHGRRHRSAATHAVLILPSTGAPYTTAAAAGMCASCRLCAFCFSQRSAWGASCAPPACCLSGQSTIPTTNAGEKKELRSPVVFRGINCFILINFVHH